MRHLLTAIFILINSTVLASNQTQAADSLLGVLKNTQSSEKRIQIYRNLADLYQENPEAHLYLLKMYQEAATIDDRKNMLNALDDILIAGISEYNKDTIAKYTEYFKKIATEDELKSLLPFYHMRTFDSRCYSGERTEAIKEELDSKNVETDKEDNVLVNAPHPEYEVVANNWEHSYTREKAAYPIESVRENKFWINVARVDNTLGDRKLLPTCYGCFE
mgnify:CR=1 FL=1